MRQILTVVGVTVAALPVGASAAAQDVPLAQLVPELILRDIVVDSPPISGLFLGVQNPDNFTHRAHFSPLRTGELNNPVIGVVQGFNTQLATQLATFPLGSATGGFTYVFDESAGTFRRDSRTFGSVFGERALTIGRRKLSAGVNYQRTSYDTLEGQNLADGSITFYLRHQDCCRVVSTPGAPISLLAEPNGTTLNPPFENDLIQAALSLKATTDTASFSASYGVTDRWDIGIAVPIVSVGLDASVTARVIRFNTVNSPTIHTFDRNNPDAPLIVRRSARATGIGDLVLRTKYSWLRVAGGGLAAAVDLRLPTGDESNLLGAGGTRAKFLFIASEERGRFDRHANVAYTVSRGEAAGTIAGVAATSAPDEIGYSGGVALAAGTRLTINGDFVGRTLRGAGRLSVASKEFKYTLLRSGTCENSGFDCTSASFDELASADGNLTLLLGTGGVKLNLTRSLLLSGSVLFPLTRAGLRGRLTTVVGFEYAR
jgi:hypothetical protein